MTIYFSSCLASLISFLKWSSAGLFTVQLFNNQRSALSLSSGIGPFHFEVIFDKFMQSNVIFGLFFHSVSVRQAQVYLIFKIWQHYRGYNTNACTVKPVLKKTCKRTHLLVDRVHRLLKTTFMIFPMVVFHESLAIYNPTKFKFSL